MKANYHQQTATYYCVNYTKTNGQKSTIEVKARNEKEAIANAKNICYTGSDFHTPERVSKK